MAEKKEVSAKEFFRSLCVQHVTAHKHVLDLDAMLDQELIIWMVIFRAWEREAVWKIMQLDDTLSGIEQAEKSKGSIYQMLQFRPRTSDALGALFMLRKQLTGNTDINPIRFIIWLNLELARIAEEVERRAGKRKLGRKMIGQIFTGADFPHKELIESVRKTARRWRRGGDILEPFRAVIEDREDREQDIIVACIRLHRRLEGKPRLLLNNDDAFQIPLLPRAASLARERSPALTRLNGLFALDDIKAMWTDILACLQGEMEKVPGRVYQSVRADDEKWSAQKRTGETISLEEPELKHLKTSSMSDKTVIHDLRWAYRIAEQRWNRRGQIFLDALREGKTVEEASCDAGVSRQTGQKYLKEIRQLFRPKKK